jgi:prophage regulatory protein
MNFKSTAAPELDVFVPYDGLREHGIPYTRVHLNRLMKAGKFPASVRLSENRIAWRLSELQVWKATRPTACEVIAA